MSVPIVARFADGRVVKGGSMDVDPNRPLFHVRTPDGQTIEVKMADLKALYFVKDHQGKPDRKDVQVPDPNDVRLRAAKSVVVTFKDGEQLVGVTHQFPVTKPFFFVIPADAGSNNVRVLVNRAFVTGVAPGP
jgi:hypothetical protein